MFMKRMYVYFLSVIKCFCYLRICINFLFTNMYVLISYLRLYDQPIEDVVNSAKNSTDSVF